MIYFNDVTKIYDSNKVVALKNASLHISKGEFVFLVGHSGAGKSSLIHLMLCEEVPTEGEVLVNGFNIGKLSRKEIPLLRRSLGVVFQDFRLLEQRTVYENVAFAMRIVGAPRSLIRRRVPEVLEMVGLLHKAHSYPAQLSGGEQQRVSMARALANNPSVLIADEPTGNLDTETANEIMKILDNINKRGTTVVMATHSEKIVNEMQRRVIAIENGSIVRDEERGRYDVI